LIRTRTTPLAMSVAFASAGMVGPASPELLG
jgi:hypothetical protein